MRLADLGARRIAGQPADFFLIAPGPILGLRGVKIGVLANKYSDFTDFQNFSMAVLDIKNGCDGFAMT